MRRISALAVAIFVAGSLVLAAVTAFAQAPAPNGQNFQPQLPAGQQIGVTNLPAPVVLQAAPTAKLPLGDYAGEVLTWVITTFGAAIGGVLTAWLIRLFKKAGVENAELFSDKLDRIIVNGLNLGAAEAKDKLAGRGVVEVQDKIMARALQYAQAHGADTLKELGVDPTSPAAIEAINARISKAIADPSKPTPAIVANAVAPQVPDAPQPPALPAPAPQSDPAAPPQPQQ